MGRGYSLKIAAGVLRPFLYKDNISSDYQTLSYIILTLYCQMNGLGKRFRTSIWRKITGFQERNWTWMFLTTYRQIKFAILVKFDMSSFITFCIFFFLLQVKKANYSRTSTNGDPFGHGLRAVSLFLEHFVENCGKNTKQAWERDCDCDHATIGSWHRHSHVTLTVTLARSLALRSSHARNSVSRSTRKLSRYLPAPIK